MTATRKVKKEIKNKKSKKKLDGTVKKSSKGKNVVVKKEAKVVKKKEKVKRKLYSTIDLQRAVNAVNRGTSVRKAALKYSVPPTSIHRAVKNPEQSNLKAGPAPILSIEVETDIVNWILYRAEKGYPITKTELLDSVQSYIRNLGDEIPKTPFTNDRPGRHWFEKFRLRHPEITIRTPQHLTMTRACVTVLQENVQKICKEINHESSNLLQENEENIGLASVDSDSTTNKKKSFANSFMLPEDHLSKKKRAKLNASGKPKLPAVGTSEEWWQVHLEKEEAKKTKEEENAKKKLLQEEKKQLAEEKKRLAEEKKDYMRKMKEKMNEIQKKIKCEKL